MRRDGDEEALVRRDGDEEALMGRDGTAQCVRCYFARYKGHVCASQSFRSPWYDGGMCKVWR